MKTCTPGCGYPYAGPACDNPRCFENPSVPAATKAEWRRADAARAQEAAERERFARLRAQSFTRPR